MRIIGGTCKGRTLATPTWAGLRPTSDRLRETLFNVLAPRVAGARMLDLYAGTGAVGLEAVSRGAGHATFVDTDPRAVRLIHQNAARCGLSSRCTIVRARVDTALSSSHSPGLLDGVFDVIFLDPPYASPDVTAALTAARARLSPSGLLVLEHASRQPPAGTLAPARVLRAGDSTLSFFTPLAEPVAP